MPYTKSHNLPVTQFLHKWYENQLAFQYEEAEGGSGDNTIQGFVDIMSIAWWATVREVAKSWTWLSNWTIRHHEGICFSPPRIGNCWKILSEVAEGAWKGVLVLWLGFHSENHLGYSVENTREGAGVNLDRLLSTLMQ